MTCEHTIKDFVKDFKDAIGHGMEDKEMDSPYNSRSINVCVYQALFFLASSTNESKHSFIGLMADMAGDAYDNANDDDEDDDDE